MSVILVTGFPTSFLAVRVVRRLLAEPSNQLRLVVQPQSIEQAEAELTRLDGPDGIAGARERVQLLEGDAASIDMGLSGVEWTTLRDEVNIIHHCMAVTYLGADRTMAERANAGGAREVVELGEAAPGFERLVHWSSALVSGAKKGYVLEEDLDGDSGFRNVVEKTRFHGERIVREAMELGLPATILRPSIIVGDSITGEIDRFEGPYLLILLMLTAPPDLTIPMPGPGNVRLNLVPVDFVVDAGTLIADREDSVGETYHLVDPLPLTALRLFETIADRTGHPVPRRFVPAAWATTLMRTPGLERFANIPRAFLEHLLTDVVYDDRNTRAALEGTGLECPQLEDYVDSMIKVVRESQQARRESTDEAEIESEPLEA